MRRRGLETKLLNPQKFESEVSSLNERRASGNASSFPKRKVSEISEPKARRPRGPWFAVALRPRSSVVVDWKVARTAAERRQTLASWHRRGYGTDEIDLGPEPSGSAYWDEPLELALRLLLTVSELELPREAIDALADFALDASKGEVEA